MHYGTTASNATHVITSSLSPINETSTTTVIPEIGNSVSGVRSTEYVYWLPATIGHPSRILSQPFRIPSGSGISITRPTKIACTFGVTVTVSNSASKIAVISNGTPLEIVHSSPWAHTDDVTSIGRVPALPVMQHN